MSRPADRLAELAALHQLPARAVTQLETLLELLSRPDAPTTVHEPERAVDVHLADSLTALELVPVREAGTIADLGSGAGLPGLPLAAALPAAQVHLVESVGRKAAFLAEAVSVCGLANVRVVDARAEEWAEGVRRCDVVTARALGRLDVLVEYAAPLLASAGRLVAWKGRREPEEEAAGDRAAEILGLELEEVRPTQPYPGSRDRNLYVYLKVRSTPNGYPRRPGMAVKRPLGGA